MSRVTNVILLAESYGGFDDRWILDRLGPINAWLAEHRHPIGLVSVEDPKLPDGWYGGTKSLEAEVAIGAFNYLNVAEFVAFLRAFPWTDDDNNVQLLVMDQDDYRWTLYDLHRDDDGPGHPEADIDRWIAEAEARWAALPKRGPWTQRVHASESTFDDEGFAAEFARSEDAEWAIAMREDWPRALRLLKRYREALKRIKDHDCDHDGDGCACVERQAEVACNALGYNGLT